WPRSSCSVCLRSGCSRTPPDRADGHHTEGRGAHPDAHRHRLPAARSAADRGEPHDGHGHLTAGGGGDTRPRRDGCGSRPLPVSIEYYEIQTTRPTTTIVDESLT